MSVQSLEPEPRAVFGLHTDAVTEPTGRGPPLPPALSGEMCFQSYPLGRKPQAGWGHLRPTQTPRPRQLGSPRAQGRGRDGHGGSCVRQTSLNPRRGCCCNHREDGFPAAGGVGLAGRPRGGGSVRKRPRTPLAWFLPLRPPPVCSRAGQPLTGREGWTPASCCGTAVRGAGLSGRRRPTASGQRMGLGRSPVPSPRRGTGRPWNTGFPICDQLSAQKHSARSELSADAIPQLTLASGGWRGAQGQGRPPACLPPALGPVSWWRNGGLAGQLRSPTF